MPEGRVSQMVIEKSVPEIKPEALEQIAKSCDLPIKTVTECLEIVKDYALTQHVCKMHQFVGSEPDLIIHIAQLIRSDFVTKKLRKLMNEEVKRRPAYSMSKEYRRRRYEQQSKENETSDIAKLKEKAKEKCFTKLVWKNSFEGFPHEKAETVHGVYRVYPEGMWNFYSHNKQVSLQHDCRSLDVGKKACQKHHEELESEVV